MLRCTRVSRFAPSHCTNPFCECDKSLGVGLFPDLPSTTHSPSAPLSSFPIQTTTHGAKDPLQGSQGGWRVKWTFKKLGPTLFVSTSSTFLLSHLLSNQSLSIDSIHPFHPIIPYSQNVKIISLSSVQ